MTRAAPARMSLASTGALESRSTPWTMTWCPSMLSSGAEAVEPRTVRKRASKRFSVIIAEPSATALQAMANGCRSVGKPG